MRPSWLGFSPFERIVHEGKVACRQLAREECSRGEIAGRLNDLLRSGKAGTSKWGLSLIIVALMLETSTNDDVIRWNAGPFTLALPRLYVFSFGAASWVLFLTQAYGVIVNLFVLMYFRSKEGAHNSLSSYRNALLGDEYGDFSGPNRVSSLSKYSVGDGLFLYLLYLVGPMIAVMLIVLAATLIHLDAVSMLVNPAFAGLDKMIAIAASVALASSSLYFVFFFVPFRVEKSLSHLRWGFLYKINSNEDGLHSSTNRWLGM